MKITARLFILAAGDTSRGQTEATSRILRDPTWIRRVGRNQAAEETLPRPDRDDVLFDVKVEGAHGLGLVKAVGIPV